MAGSTCSYAVIASAGARLHVDAKEDAILLGGGDGAQIEATNFRGIGGNKVPRIPGTSCGQRSKWSGRKFLAAGRHRPHEPREQNYT